MAIHDFREAFDKITAPSQRPAEGRRGERIVNDEHRSASVAISASSRRSAMRNSGLLIVSTKTSRVRSVIAAAVAFKSVVETIVEAIPSRAASSTHNAWAWSDN